MNEYPATGTGATCPECGAPANVVRGVPNPMYGWRFDASRVVAERIERLTDEQLGRLAQRIDDAYDHGVWDIGLVRDAVRALAEGEGE